MKNTIIELKNSLERFNSRLDQAEERIRDLQGNCLVRGAKRTKNKNEWQILKEL